MCSRFKEPNVNDAICVKYNKNISMIVNINKIYIAFLYAKFWLVLEARQEG